MQNDSGANRSITNNKRILIHYRPIKDYPINGVGNDGPAVTCTGYGYIPWQAGDGERILVRCYYSEQASGTIISPTDIVLQHSDRYTGWTMDTDMPSSTGTLQFKGKDGVSHTVFESYMENGLWFHYLNSIPTLDKHGIANSINAVVKKLSSGAEYELWHHRLGHPGSKVMSVIHNHVKGIPQLKRHPFYSCSSCMAGKFKKPHFGQKRRFASPSTPDIPPQELDITSHDPSIKVGQHLHMDFGFVRGSDWSQKDNDGKLVTSIDKYRSYLLVIDRASRHIWVFLTKTKHPPIDQVRGLLSKFQKDLPADASITTDQGKELGASKQFQLLCKEMNYNLRVTGAYSSAQNGMAEKPNQDLARTMRCLLYSAGLGSEYWSYALRHAVYLKNRLPHTSLNNTTPFELINGFKPDLSKLKVFGARVQIRNTGDRHMKLDRISEQGTFMTYKGTDKVMYVVNTQGKEWITAQIVFDEAYMSESSTAIPPMAKALQTAGYRPQPYSNTPDPVNTNTIHLRFKHLSDQATTPTQGSDEAAGLDVYSAEATTIPTGTQGLISTKIAMQLPPNHYGQLQPRSGLALKHSIDIGGGVIDSDYRGEIKVIVINDGDKPFQIKQGDRIAQLIIHRLPKLLIETVDQLSPTTRDKAGFGSTGISTNTGTNFQQSNNNNKNNTINETNNNKNNNNTINENTNTNTNNNNNNTNTINEKNNNTDNNNNTINENNNNIIRDNKNNTTPSTIFTDIIPTKHIIPPDMDQPTLIPNITKSDTNYDDTHDDLHLPI